MVDESAEFRRGKDLEPPRPGRSQDLAARTGGALFGLLIGAAFGGPLGAAAGAVIGTLVTPLMEDWVALCIQEFNPRGQTIIDAAVVTSHLDEDQVIEAITTSPDLQPIVQRILDAAARTNHEQTLRLLGGILGDSIGNRPRVDEDLLFVEGIAGLGPAHLRVLEALESHSAESPDQAASAGTLSTRLRGELSEHAIRAALGGLQSRGMIQDPGAYGGGSWVEISPFGEAVLEALRAVT